MQILIEIDENLGETLDKVKERVSNGFTKSNSDPKFRIVYDYEELPMSDEDVEEYRKQKSLEKMQEILSKGFDPFA